MNDTITCNSCGYSGNINFYLPCFSSVYADCRCPKCGSTNNDYNDAFAAVISKAFKQADKTVKKSALDYMAERIRSLKDKLEHEQQNKEISSPLL
jgi:hypothetical protein